MTLYKYTFPPFLQNREVICKNRFEYKNKLKKYFLSKYLNYRDAEICFPKEHFWETLVNTKKIMAFQVNEGSIYVHPDGYFNEVRKIQQRRIIRKFFKMQSPQEYH